MESATPALCFYVCLQEKGITGTLETMHRHASTQQEMTQENLLPRPPHHQERLTFPKTYHPKKKGQRVRPYPAPAANVLLSRNLAPYFHSKNGAGNPSPIATKASKLFPHP